VLPCVPVHSQALVTCDLPTLPPTWWPKLALRFPLHRRPAHNPANTCPLGCTGADDNAQYPEHIGTHDDPADESAHHACAHQPAESCAFAVAY
jgi:hypothetical protein